VVAACIPAFNEEATIARVVLLAERYVDRVFVCDDGSTDLTGIIAEALSAARELRSSWSASRPSTRRVAMEATENSVIMSLIAWSAGLSYAYSS
jgi:glycosyltransferase involved in cell wall biosynthesis